MFAHPFRSLTLLVAILLVGSSLQAQGPGRHFRRVNRQGLMGLNLSDAQKAQIKTLRDQHQAAFKAKGEAAMDARRAMRSAMMKPETEVATLKALHEKAAAAQFEVMMERRALHQEILPLLTPDQRAQLQKRMTDMEQRGPRGRGFGPHKGGAPASPGTQPS